VLGWGQAYSRDRPVKSSGVGAPLKIERREGVDGALMRSFFKAPDVAYITDL